MSLLLRVAALVLFILAVIFYVLVNGVSNEVADALVAAGLACWVASTLVGGITVRA